MDGAQAPASSGSLWLGEGTGIRGQVWTPVVTCKCKAYRQLDRPESVVAYPSRTNASSTRAAADPATTAMGSRKSSRKCWRPNCEVVKVTTVDRWARSSAMARWIGATVGRLEPG